MQSLEKLNESSGISIYRVKTQQTVADVLKELGLEGAFFAVLLNGQKADLTAIITPMDDITILPKIAGG